MDVTNLSGIEVVFIRGGRESYTIPGPYPAQFGGGVVVSVPEAIAWDGSTSGRRDEQPNERFRAVFLKGGVVQGATLWTGDAGDDGIATGWFSDYWRGPLDDSLVLPNGADEIRLVHWSNPTLGAGDRSSPNSVVPVSICLSAEPLSLGDRVWEDSDADGIQACVDGGAGDPAHPADGIIGNAGDSGPECDAGIPDVRVDLLENPDGDPACNSGDELIDGTAYTDADGFYRFDDLDPAKNYCVSVDRPSVDDELLCDPIIGSATFSPPLQGGDGDRDSDADITTGRSGNISADGFDLSWDAGLYCPAKIGDLLVRDDNGDGIQQPDEPGVDGQTVELIECVGGVPGDVVDTTITSGGGMYMFNPLAPGEYAIRFTAPGGTVFSPQDQGGNDAVDCDADMLGLTQCVALSANEYDDTVDACVSPPPAGLGDRLWQDLDADGAQDDGEPGVPGVSVSLLSPGADGACDTGDEVFIAGTTTATNGYYAFTDLAPASYCVAFDQPLDLCEFGDPTFTARNATDDDRDSDVNPATGQTGNIDLPAGVFDDSNDAGVFCPAKLGNLVWLDDDSNGVQDDVPADEQPVGGVTVNLEDCSGNPVTDLNGNGSLVTDSLGMYMFLVNPGAYTVRFEAPFGQSLTAADVGPDDTVDSDANPLTGRSQCVTVPSNTYDDTIDAGVVPPQECGLAVNKQCTVLTPAPAQPFTCDGKIDALTMRYDGSLGPLTSVRAFAGDQSRAELPVSIDGDIVSVSGYQAAGAPNDVVWLVNGSTISTFHLSCSDGEMDGETDDPAFPNDCARPEGNGKSNGGINAWTLEGLATESGNVLACSPAEPVLAESCSFPAEIATCDTLPHDPEVLTFRYTGGGCAASDNDQKPADATCSGGIDPTQAVMVTFHGTTIEVAPGGSFDVPRSDADKIELSNVGGTEFLELHTSCSQPLQTGDVYGSLTLAALDGVGIGRDVLFTYDVANNGTGVIGNVAAVDSILGPVGGVSSLAPGASIRLEATGFVESTTTNTVTVSGDAAGVASCQATDTLTVTVLPPPPCSVSVTFDKLEDDKIKWKVRNTGNRIATLETFVLSFPAGYLSIKEVKLDGGIWKNNESPLDGTSGSLIGAGDWTQSDVSKRQLDPGEERTLEIVFSEKQHKELYRDDISGNFSGAAGFEEGCSIDL